MSHKIEWDGEILSLRKICKKEGISEYAVYRRISMTGEDPKTVLLYYLNQPNKGNREKIEIDGIVADLRTHCKRLDISYNSVLARIRKTGESAKESLLYFLNQPNKGNREKFNLNGKSLDIKKYCKKVGVNYGAVFRYKKLHPDMKYVDIINMLKNNVGGGIREKLELNGEYLDVKNYCKKLNYDYKLITRYKASQPDKTYTEVLKEWENLSQDEILNNIHLFEIWQKVIDRCYNPKNPAYKWYGGKKINPTRVYKKWQDYAGFKEDNWEEYTNHIKQYGRKQTSIDREDESGDYCPSNCSWGDWEQQGRNTSRTKYILPCKNYQKTLSQHCITNNYSYDTITYYIRQYNLSPDKALAKYLAKRKKK